MSRNIRKIPIASASGNSDFSLTSNEWRRIEKAYGRTLSKAVRKRILDATQRFIYFEEFERNAASAAEALNRITEIEKQTKLLLAKLMKERAAAEFYAEHLIQRNFHDARLFLNHGNLFSPLYGVLNSLRAACAKASAELKSPKHPKLRPGDSWEQWVRRLSSIAQVARLPHAASKGRAKSKTAKDSSFTMLISALQEFVPAPARRHQLGPDGLASAIARARKPRITGPKV